MKIKRRALVRAMRRVAIASSILIFLALMYSYWYSDIFTIQSYQISGVDEESRKSIENELHALGAKKVYGIFPRNKIFTYSTDLITTGIINALPEAASVDIRPVGLHTIKIHVTLLTPLFRISDTEGLTSDGIIFSTKYNISIRPRITIDSYTTKVIKKNNLTFTQIVLKDEMARPYFFTELNALVGKISSVVVSVDHVVIESTGDISLFTPGKDARIVFLKDSDFKKIWTTLVSAVDTDPLKLKLATAKNKLEYLDVRYGNKVFYRFNDMAFQKDSATAILRNHATTTHTTSGSSSDSH